MVEKKTKPYIQVDIGGGQTKTFAPEEISAMVLTKMKETAEAYLGKKVSIPRTTLLLFFLIVLYRCHHQFNDLNLNYIYISYYCRPKKIIGTLQVLSVDAYKSLGIKIYILRPFCK